MGEERKIAIVGTAPDSVEFAPWGDTSWEVWIVKNIGVPRWDAAFELHPPEAGMGRWPQPYKEFLRQKHGKPIYMAQPAEWVPDAVVFPWQRVVELFQCRYITNSVSWMIAFAIAQEALGNGKVVEIGVWGVDMAQYGVGCRSEYAYQRPSCEFWLGLAAGRGIAMHVPAQSDLLKCRKMYGVEDDDFDEKARRRRKGLEQKVHNAASLEQKHHDQRLIYEGALQSMLWAEQWAQNWKGEPEDESKPA